MTQSHSAGIMKTSSGGGHGEGVEQCDEILETSGPARPVGFVGTGIDVAVRSAARTVCVILSGSA